MDIWLFSLLMFAGCAACFGAARLADRRIGLGAALAAALYVALDDLATGLPSLLPALAVPGADWNWSGKLLSLAVAAAVIAALRLPRARVGLVAPTHVRTGLVALALFAAWGTGLGLLFRPGEAGAETLAFQASMPGLAEELAYRGIVPALLLGAAMADTARRTPWAVVVATALAFGLWHGLRVDGGAIGFDAMSALFPALGSLAGGWLRFRTRSLVFPVLAHGIANVAFHLAGAAVA